MTKPTQWISHFGVITLFLFCVPTSFGQKEHSAILQFVEDGDTQLTLTRTTNGIKWSCQGKSGNQKLKTTPVDFGDDIYFHRELMKPDQRIPIHVAADGTKIGLFRLKETVWEDGSIELEIGLENGNNFDEVKLTMRRSKPNVAKVSFAERVKRPRPKATPILDNELDQIEKETSVQLPKRFRDFMIKNSETMQSCTLNEEDAVIVWRNHGFFNGVTQNVIHENLSQREKDTYADILPNWWNEYFLIGTNYGGDYYVIKLDGSPGVYFLS